MSNNLIFQWIVSQKHGKHRGGEVSASCIMGERIAKRFGDAQGKANAAMSDFMQVVLSVKRYSNWHSYIA